jgi:hypothetical protein
MPATGQAMGAAVSNPAAHCILFANLLEWFTPRLRSLQRKGELLARVLLAHV